VWLTTPRRKNKLVMKDHKKHEMTEENHEAPQLRSASLAA
jgi:hypothetical protein